MSAATEPPRSRAKATMKSIMPTVAKPRSCIGAEIYTARPPFTGRQRRASPTVGDLATMRGRNRTNLARALACCLVALVAVAPAADAAGKGKQQKPKRPFVYL